MVVVSSIGSIGYYGVNYCCWTPVVEGVRIQFILVVETAGGAVEGRRECRALAIFLLVAEYHEAVFTLVDDIELQQRRRILRRESDVALDSRQRFSGAGRTGFPTVARRPCPAAELVGVTSVVGLDGRLPGVCRHGVIVDGLVRVERDAVIVFEHSRVLARRFVEERGIYHAVFGDRH